MWPFENLPETGPVIENEEDIVSYRIQDTLLEDFEQVAGDFGSLGVWYRVIPCFRRKRAKKAQVPEYR